MPERIDELRYAEPTRESTREILESSLYLTSPAEFLVETLVRELEKDSVWSTLFGGYIANYERMDFSIRSLPAMRVYCERWRKDGESWYMVGDVLIDVIWPPAIRRGELNRLPSTIAGALLQQLRRPTFFQTICDQVPGLNELGKTINADFDLAYKLNDDLVPLTRITANFRILLDEWDQYMTDDYRTVDDPFKRTLGDLKTLTTVIEALRSDDPDSVDLILASSQKLT